MNVPNPYPNPNPNPDPKQLKEYQALTILKNAKIESNNCLICDLF